MSRRGKYQLSLGHLLNHKKRCVSLQIDGTKDSGIEINTTGTRHLGAAVGTPKFKTDYVNKKIDGWIAAVKKLAVIASSQPHAAFAAFTQCMQGQWTFISRAMPDVSHLFLRLEEVIRLHFLPALLRRHVNDIERQVLSLPARLVGLGICHHTQTVLMHTKIQRD